jgi:hypothetical protein
MTEHHDSPQSGPVDIKTDKDSHYHSQEHTKPAGVQNEAYTPTTEEVRSQYQERGNLGWLPNVDPYNFDKQAMRDEFDRWLRKVKAKAWDEGWVDGACTPGQHPREFNPYESEAPHES